MNASGKRGGRGGRGGRHSIRIPSRPPAKKSRSEESTEPETQAPVSPADERLDEHEEQQKQQESEEQKEVEVAEEPAEKRPRPPVRCRSSYLFFCAAKSDEVTAENPYASCAEVHCLLGQIWRSMSNDERQVCCIVYSLFHMMSMLFI